MQETSRRVVVHGRGVIDGRQHAQGLDVRLGHDWLVFLHVCALRGGREARRVGVGVRGRGYRVHQLGGVRRGGVVRGRAVRRGGGSCGGGGGGLRGRVGGARRGVGRVHLHGEVLEPRRAAGRHLHRVVRVARGHQRATIAVREDGAGRCRVTLVADRLCCGHAPKVHPRVVALGGGCHGDGGRGSGGQDRDVVGPRREQLAHGGLDLAQTDVVERRSGRDVGDLPSRRRSGHVRSIGGGGRGEDHAARVGETVEVAVRRAHRGLLGGGAHPGMDLVGVGGDGLAGRVEAVARVGESGRGDWRALRAHDVALGGDREGRARVRRAVGGGASLIVGLLWEVRVVVLRLG